MVKVIAGGCFNAIHPGHEYFLREARKLGDFLVIVLTNDANNRKPYALPALERKATMEKLGIADKVVIGNAEDFSAVVREEKPDIIALGYDQKLMEPTKKEADKLGIRIVKLGKLGNYSTRDMKNAHEKS